MKKRVLPQEINNLINLLDSDDSENWKLALNILANPSFKVKRQLCQAVKFAKIYIKHPYQLYRFQDVLIPLNGETFTVSQFETISRRCLRYLKLYRDYDKRRVN